MKNNNYLKSISLIFFSFILLSGCSNSNENNLDTTQETSEYINLSTNSEIENKEEIYSQNEELLSKIDKLNNACISFYDKYKNESCLFSIYSFLNISDDQNNYTDIDIEYLKNNGFLENDFNIDNSLILYVKEADFFEDGDNNLQIITAIKVDDNYIISSLQNKRNVISSNEFSNIILKYAFNHGELVNPKPSDKAFNEILEAISEYNGVKGGFMVRHIVYDELYSIVVLSSESNLENMYEYLLIKNDGKWHVDSEFQDEKYPKFIINQKYPDFELGMFPNL